jgi:uncharacterized protein YbaR (Trm112 family)
MDHPELIEILCCPETHQKIALADAATIQAVNDRIAAGQTQNRAGKKVEQKLEEGLIREDGKVLYPIRNGIPVMLIDEGISL